MTMQDKPQTQIPWWNVELGDDVAEAVAEAVRNRSVSMGGVAAEFERRVAECLDVPHVVAVTNGTSALVVALLEAGVKPGDEVIAPALTWIATAHAATLIGARAILVDVEKERPVMSADALAAAVTPRTRAIMPVHFNGRACDMPAILEAADRRGIAVIEDAAQAFLCKSDDGRFLGTVGRCGCFSLSMGKLVTSGQGGFIATRDDETARRLRLIRTHGVGSVMEPEWSMTGGNFRYTDLHAAIGLTQLEKAERRKASILEVYAYYRDNLAERPGVRLANFADPDREIPLYIEVYTSRRKSLFEFLLSRGIQAREFYPALNRAPQFGPQPGDFANAEAFASQGLWLPSGPDRTEEELRYVVGAVNEWSEGN